MIKKLFSFEGRISKREYRATMIGLFLFIAIFALIILPSMAFSNINQIVGAFIIVGIPLNWIKLAQATKRCHDLGKSGWWQLVPFYGFSLYYGDGETKANQYGECP